MVFPDVFMNTLGPNLAQGGMNQAGFAMAVAASTVILTIVQQFLFKHLTGFVERTIRKLIDSLNPFVHIKFMEDTDEGGPKNDQAYEAIETYLSAKCGDKAARLKANAVKDIRTPVLCLDGGEGVPDEYKGVQVSWHMTEEKEKGDPYHAPTKSKFYILSFRKSNRALIVGEYIKYVMDEGKATAARNKHLKLYSNNSREMGRAHWSHIMDLDHPATFDTVAMSDEMKKEIIDDLMRFKNGRDYYRQIGKPWKRGYLLHGPPGTGKSTMIAAMANLLNFDVYDLELTAVMNNAALKKLLFRMPGNSILVIEDIDCSSKITTNRETTKQDDENKIIEKVTLSGLLNCLDGIFSANEGGRLMIFTTNHIENLDPALVRRGRMDKHIEMSYCRFEGFKVLAKNYLGIVEHELFPEIRKLLQEVEITPADVAENLIRREQEEGSEIVCFQTLIEVLENKKEEDKKLRDLEKKKEEDKKLRDSKDLEKKHEVAEPDGIVRENGTHAKENGHSK